MIKALELLSFTNSSFLTNLDSIKQIWNNTVSYFLKFLSFIPLQRLSLSVPSWWIGCLMRVSTSERSHLWFQPIRHQRSTANQWSSGPVPPTVWSPELWGDAPGTERRWEAKIHQHGISQEHVTSHLQVSRCQTCFVFFCVFRRCWTACCSTQSLSFPPRSDTLSTKQQEKSGNYTLWYYISVIRPSVCCSVYPLWMRVYPVVVFLQDIV